VNLFFFKKFASLPGVAAYKNCRKASGNGGLRFNRNKSKVLEMILNMVMVRNLIRLVGTLLNYRSLQINDQVVR